MKTVSLIKSVACCAALAAFAISFQSCCKSSIVQDPEEPETKVVAIPYTASVGSDNTDSSTAPQTRATINSSKKYIFQAGDRLFVENTDSGHEGDVYGYLTIATGEGTSSATFDGTLYSKNGFTPADNTPLKATLVSVNDRIHSISSDGFTITGTSYPSSIAADLAEAVSMFSDFTSTGLYGTKSFILQQSSAFVSFSILFEVGDKISLGQIVDVAVTPNSDPSTSRSASLVVVQPGSYKKIVFTAAFPGGTKLDADANISLDWFLSPNNYHKVVSFGSSNTLQANKSYNVGRSIVDVSITI